eukprot:NODE_3_length_80033_cov_0.932970.p51 type:complete len:194 gc:universal NODE_3_length_80033_cov_0.932970:22344-22925(+)
MKKSSNQLLVIFDLNGTLLYRARAKKDTWSKDIPDDAEPVGTIKGRKVYLRPYLKELLTESEYEYAFWTSANEDNAISMINYIPYTKPLFIWGRSKCTANPNGEKPWSVYKDLDLIDKNLYSRYIIVDDSVDKFSAEHQKLHIAIPEYTCQSADYVLLALRSYLDEVLRSKNYVEFLEKNNFSDFLKDFQFIE